MASLPGYEKDSQAGRDNDVAFAKHLLKNRPWVPDRRGREPEVRVVIGELENGEREKGHEMELRGGGGENKEHWNPEIESESEDEDEDENEDYEEDTPIPTKKRIFIDLTEDSDDDQPQQPPPERYHKKPRMSH